MPGTRYVTILIANLPAERDRRVIRECLSLERDGYEVTVIAPRGDRTLRILPGSRNTRLKPYPVYVYGSGVLSFAFEFAWSFAWITARLLGEVIRGRAHGVQVCNPPDVYWPLALLMRVLGRPWVFDHHDLCPEVYATRAGGRPNRWAYRALVAFEWLTLRTATAVVSTNESFRDHALRRGVPARRVTVVRNGPSTDEVAAAAGVAGVAATPGHRIVYLGVLGPQDNVEAAILAADELIRRRGRTGWRMTIAGDGESLPDLTRLVSERGMGDVVEFTGWLDGHRVDDLLRSATIAIQPDAPTRMNDLSTMAKTVEYVARGIPVVAADMVETRRTAGEAAVYVPNGSAVEFGTAIHELLDDPDRRSRMRAAGLERFANGLSWERQVAAYLQVWHQVLGRSTSTQPPPRMPRQRRAEPATALLDDPADAR